MKKKMKMKTYALEEITDMYIGKIGTKKRDAFEYKLRLELNQKVI